MPVTLKDVRDELRERLNELNARQWSDSILNKWINEGARDLARRTECIRDRATINLVVGTQEYTGPTDAIRIHRVEYRESDRTITLEYRDFNSMDQVWWTAQRDTEGIPGLYTMWGMPPSLKLVLFPTPSVASTTLTVYYYRYPANVQSDMSTVECPEGWYDAIVTYAEMMALRRDDQEKWVASKEMYEEKMTDLLVTAQRFSDASGMIDGWSGGGGAMPGWLVGGNGY